MKITCLIHSLDGGGAERVMAGLASRLAQRNHQVTLVTLDDGSHDRHEIDTAVVRKPLDVMCESGSIFSAIANTRWRVRKLRDAFVDSAPDVILSFCDRTNILALMAARTTGIPVVVSERSDPSQQDLGRAWERLRRWTYRRADAIVAQTQTSADHLSRLLGWTSSSASASKIHVIASAVQSPPVISDRVAAQANRRVIGIGRLEREKGFDRLIDAFGQSTESDPQWTLRILGEGSLRETLQHQISELGLEERVALPGWVRPVWNELAESTLFVLPSRYEGFPSALLEAMATGVPSVATDCESGPRAILQDGVNGLLVGNQTDALASAITRLIQDQDLRETLGKSGTNVIKQFGWETMVDAYEDLLRLNQSHEN